MELHCCTWKFSCPTRSMVCITRDNVYTGRLAKKSSFQLLYFRSSLVGTSLWTSVVGNIPLHLCWERSSEALVGTFVWKCLMSTILEVFWWFTVEFCDGSLSCSLKLISEGSLVLWWWSMKVFLVLCWWSLKALIWAVESQFQSALVNT